MNKFGKHHLNWGGGGDDVSFRSAVAPPAGKRPWLYIYKQTECERRIFVAATELTCYTWGSSHIWFRFMNPVRTKSSMPVGFNSNRKSQLQVFSAQVRFFPSELCVFVLVCNIYLCVLRFVSYCFACIINTRVYISAQAHDLPAKTSLIFSKRGPGTHRGPWRGSKGSPAKRGIINFHLNSIYK